MPKLTEQLAAPLRQMQVRRHDGTIVKMFQSSNLVEKVSTDCDRCCRVQECAKRIAKVSADAKLEVDEETYMNQFKPHLMDVVYAWTNGATFAQICKMTDVFEGWSLMGQGVKMRNAYSRLFLSSLRRTESIL